MRDIWFTSDWHIGHANIIKFCNRPFSNISEMNEAIIENHNALVKPKDVVYHHGDLFFKIGYKNISYFMSKFNGVFHVIKGNHDKESVLKRLKDDGLIESFQHVLGLSVDKKYIWMSHYPHRSWNRSFHGSWHTFGHCHGTLEPYKLSFDVGVDCWDFKPLHFDEVDKRMKQLQFMIEYNKKQLEVKIS